MTVPSQNTGLKQLREGAGCLDHCFTGYHGSEGDLLGEWVGGHIVSTVKKQRAMGAGTDPASPFSSQSPTSDGATHILVHGNTIKDTLRRLFLG